MVGLGRNGRPVADALLALGAAVTVWDDNEQARAAAPFPLHDPSRGLAGFDALVLSPGIPHRLPAPHPAAEAARAAGIPILSDAELLFQAVRARGGQTRFVGITGTNGKSTHHGRCWTTFFAALAGTRRQAANLGTAALALPRLRDDGVYVLEMSSYMLERLDTLRFDVAALLNLSPDHLDRQRRTWRAMRRPSARCFARQQPGDTAVLGIDDPDTAAIAAGMACVTVSGARPAAIWCDGAMLRDASGAIMPMAEAAALPGPHNAQNAAAATAMARALGVADDAIIAGDRQLSRPCRTASSAWP